MKLKPPLLFKNCILVPTLWRCTNIPWPFSNSKRFALKHSCMLPSLIVKNWKILRLFQNPLTGSVFSFHKIRFVGFFDQIFCFSGISLDYIQLCFNIWTPQQFILQFEFQKLKMHLSFTSFIERTYCVLNASFHTSFDASGFNVLPNSQSPFFNLNFLLAQIDFRSGLTWEHDIVLEHSWIFLDMLIQMYLSFESLVCMVLSLKLVLKAGLSVPSSGVLIPLRKILQFPAVSKQLELKLYNTLKTVQQTEFKDGKRDSANAFRKFAWIFSKSILCEEYRNWISNVKFEIFYTCVKNIHTISSKWSYSQHFSLVLVSEK